MGKTYQKLNDQHIEFIAAQQMFFVATAPLAETGHVNVSPKGLDSLRIIDKQTIIYMDLFGSGVETIAHIRENQRLTLMFCAFNGKPNIVRTYGTGEVIDSEHIEWEYLRSLFAIDVKIRAIIRQSIQRVSDSCGYGVPVFEFVEQRKKLVDWAKQRAESGLLDYARRKNQKSIDDLPALDLE